jgi:hypothetical protein
MLCESSIFWQKCLKLNEGGVGASGKPENRFAKVAAGSKTNGIRMLRKRTRIILGESACSATIEAAIEINRALDLIYEFACLDCKGIELERPVFDGKAGFQVFKLVVLQRIQSKPGNKNVGDVQIYDLAIAQLGFAVDG